MNGESSLPPRAPEPGRTGGSGRADDHGDAVDTCSEAETRALAARFAARLGAGDVVALEGPLGAGKTAFLRGLADGLGLADGERVSSPSYALIHVYALDADVRGADRLAHLDLYRLDDDESFEALGVDDLLESAVVAIEWAERIPAAIALATWRVAIADLGPEARRVTIRRTSRG